MKMKRAPIVRTSQRMTPRSFSRNSSSPCLPKSSFSQDKVPIIDQSIGYSRGCQEAQMKKKAGVLKQIIRNSRLSEFFKTINDQIVDQKQKYLERETERQEQQRLEEEWKSSRIRANKTTTNKSLPRNNSNFSRLISEFDSIPEEEYTYLVNIQNQISKIKNTLNNTYDLLKMEQDKAQNSSRFLDEIIDTQKRNKKNKRRTNISDNYSSIKQTEGQRKERSTHKFKPKRRRQFEKERSMYLHNSQKTTKRKNDKASKRLDSQKQNTGMRQRTKTITHQIIQPVFHGYYPSMTHTLVPTTTISSIYTPHTYNMTFIPMTDQSYYHAMTSRCNSSYSTFTSRQMNPRMTAPTTSRANIVSFF